MVYHAGLVLLLSLSRKEKMTCWNLSLAQDQARRRVESTGLDAIIGVLAYCAPCEPHTNDQLRIVTTFRSLCESHESPDFEQRADTVLRDGPGTRSGTFTHQSSLSPSEAKNQPSLERFDMSSLATRQDNNTLPYDLSLYRSVTNSTAYDTSFMDLDTSSSSRSFPSSSTNLSQEGFTSPDYLYTNWGQAKPNPFDPNTPFLQHAGSASSGEGSHIAAQQAQQAQLLLQMTLSPQHYPSWSSDSPQGYQYSTYSSADS